MCRKPENVIYNDIIESFSEIPFGLGQKLRFLRILKSAQHRNFSSPSDLKNAQLLNRLSYRGAQITIGKGENIL
jgi:hypothetical protein